MAFDASERFFSTRIGGTVQRVHKALCALKQTLSDIGRNRRTLDELTKMSDYELADIGLCRSDLSIEGLTIVASKRALEQDAVAREFASTPEHREVPTHEH
ncbi:MAG: DUF1127 domain-containing protein [Pseudomonadota bacterium]